MVLIDNGINTVRDLSVDEIKEKIGKKDSPITESEKNKIADLAKDISAFVTAADILNFMRDYMPWLSKKKLYKLIEDIIWFEYVEGKKECTEREWLEKIAKNCNVKITTLDYIRSNAL
jgi:hypothetical protein